MLRIFRREQIAGWRRHWRVFGRPDFAFPKTRLAVFVDGCFWHGCPKCYQAPKAAREFWDEKLRKNIERDAKVSRRLRKEGWKVIRVWECQLKSPVRLLMTLKKYANRS